MNMSKDNIELFYLSSTKTAKVNFCLKVELAIELKKKCPVKRDVYRAIADKYGCIDWRSVENIANSKRFKEFFMQRKPIY